MEEKARDVRAVRHNTKFEDGMRCYAARYSTDGSTSTPRVSNGAFEKERDCAECGVPDCVDSAT